MLAATMPRAFTLRNKQLGPDGRSARLIVSGTGGNLVEGRPEMLYGSIRMVTERGEWKVEASSWSNEQPGILAPVKPASTPSAGKAAATQGAPVVGSTSAAPLRKLGTAKPPCVYKPVMTAEDIENCR